MKWHRIWNAQIIATNIQKETGPNPKRDRTNGGGYVGEGGKRLRCFQLKPISKTNIQKETGPHPKNNRTNGATYLRLPEFRRAESVMY